jgi:Na+-driven multidrug efflux pump
LAAPAVLLCSASNGVMRGYLDTRTPTLILLGSNLVNLALDVILVANMGMGPRGAGIATTVAEWIAALCFLGVLSGKLPTASGGDDWKKSIIRRSDALDNQKDKYNGGEVLLTVTPLLELPTWEDIRPLVAASSAVFLRSIVLQVAMSSAAAMAARSTPIDGMIAITSGASASVAAHQVALQLWLLCSFLCDALATASQALVADGKGRNDVDAVRTVSQTVFNWGLALGLTLSTCLWVGTASGFLIDFFTSDDVTRIELGKLLTIVILAQPLNSFVFAADGVLQGAGEFIYQAKSMALSVISAFAMFAVLEYTSYGREILTGNDSDTLVHVWYALIILQAVRGITSLVKVVEPMGPIDLFGKKVPT